MARETHELQLLNNNNLKDAHETLLNALVMHVQQHTQQHMELVLYDNTKQQYERRRENDRQLTSVISDALSNAELIWISIQLDLERKRNCINSCTGAYYLLSITIVLYAAKKEMLCPFVYDSPLEQPMLENVRYLSYF